MSSLHGYYQARAMELQVTCFPYRGGLSLQKGLCCQKAISLFLQLESLRDGGIHQFSDFSHALTRKGCVFLLVTS